MFSPKARWWLPVEPKCCGKTPKCEPRISAALKETHDMAAQANVLELTKQLVRMNTVNPPGQEEQCARHLGSLLEKHGFSTNYHELAPGRASLVATIGGRADKAPLCFTGHI